MRAPGNVPSSRVRALAACVIVFLALAMTGSPQAPALAMAGTGSVAVMGNDGDLAAGIGYIERGMFEEAAAALSRAIAESPDAPEAPDVAKAFDLLGYATWCMGREEEALVAFRESLQHAGDAREQFRARVGAGQALLDLGKVEDACCEFEAALDVATGPEDLDVAYTLLGIAKFEANDTVGAVEMFSRALEAFPQDPVASAYLEKLSFGVPIHFGSVREALQKAALALGGRPGGAAAAAPPLAEGDEDGVAGDVMGAADSAGSPSSEADMNGAPALLSGVLLINGGASYATTSQVRLMLGVDPAVPLRGFFLAVGDEPFRWHDWRSAVIEWCPRGEVKDGKTVIKAVYYAAGTSAPGGGTSGGGAGMAAQGACVAEASIVLDREPPWGSLEINSGARFTNETRVSLRLQANDRTSGVLNVSMSNDGATWSAWTMYQLTKDWDVPPGDGVKRVYARFQDRAGNVSAPVSARIVLDTRPPGLLWVRVAALGATTADIAWTTDEDSDSAVEYAEDQDAGRKSTTVRDKDMTMLHHIKLDGLKPSTKYRFRVLSRDAAGNVAVSRVLEFSTKAANAGS